VHVAPLSFVQHELKTGKLKQLALFLKKHQLFTIAPIFLRVGNRHELLVPAMSCPHGTTSRRYPP
jgi:hypothetical protein